MQIRSETNLNPNPIRSNWIFSDFGSSKIISDRIKLFCSRIGLEPDFQLLELEKESSSVKVDFSDRIGFGLDHFGLDRIRILKFTNYRIGNFQSDPIHTFRQNISYWHAVQ